MSKPWNDKIALITDNFLIAAGVSSVMQQTGKYFAVIEAPRTHRPDKDNEIIRAVNALRYLEVTTIIVACIDEWVVDKIARDYPCEVVTVSSLEDAKAKFEFDDRYLSGTSIDAAQLLYDQNSKVEQYEDLVLVEDSDSVANIIAANYAIYHNANLVILPYQSGSNLSSRIERFLSVLDDKDQPTREKYIQECINEIKEIFPKTIDFTKYKRILSVTSSLPYHLAIDNNYVVMQFCFNLGKTLIKSLREGLTMTGRIGGMVGFSVQTNDINSDNEITYFENALERAEGCITSIKGRHAEITKYEIETYPYDILYIASHGKRLDGYQNIYKYLAKDSIQYEVIVEELIETYTNFMEITSINSIGVNSDVWHSNGLDRIAAEFYLGSREYKGELIESKRIKLNLRGIILDSAGSPSTQYPLTLHRLASGYNPLAIINACGSWNEIAPRLSFGETSGYIGTLWPVTNQTADQFAELFFDSLFRMDLIDAFGLARAGLEGNDFIKRAYIMTGSFESRFSVPLGYWRSGEATLEARAKQSIEKINKAFKASSVKERLKIDKYILEEILKDLDSV